MIIGVDQVLLDLVVEVDDDPTIFERYGLERNTQCLAEPRHATLIADLIARAADEEKAPLGGARGAAAPVRQTPGGVVGNALRAAAWRFRAAGVEASSVPALRMMGRVGQDAAGERLRKAMAEAGVEPLFDCKPPGGSGRREPEGTGVCCCLIAGKERTMVTQLGAGRTMELRGGPGGRDWRARYAEAAAGSQPARGRPVLVLVSAFYAHAEPEGVLAIREWVAAGAAAAGARSGGVGEAAQRPLLAFALSAQWCTSLPIVQEIARIADFVFGNEPEMVALAKAIGAGELPSEAALAHVAAWKAQGLVVATRGSKSVGLCRAGARGAAPLEVPVPALPPEEFVDDVGAGDSFMGGFLAAAWQCLALGGGVTPQDLTDGQLVEAAKVGISTAGAVLRTVGCQFPVAAPS